MTPMMQQWHVCKEKAKDALLFFRLGDFYEAFHEDAAIISKELDLVLTKRQDVPMAGIPFHSSETYIDRLVSKGFRIAIAEQLDDPSTTKGLVRRDVVRVITPGTLIDSNLLEEKAPNYVASLCQINTLFGLAVIDVSTADFRVYEFEEKSLVLDELARLRPCEILLSDKCSLKPEGSICLLERPSWHFNSQAAYESLCQQFAVSTLDGFGLAGKVAAIGAAGALLHYVRDELSLSTQHLRSLQLENTCSFMAIDRTTQRHLELMNPLHEKGRSVLSLIDRTLTPMGGRLLRQWLLHPLLDLQEIRHRQEWVEKLLSPTPLRELLKPVRDLERLAMRIETGYASPRDLLHLRLSLEPLPLISPFLESPLPDFSDLTHKLTQAIVDIPPLKITEGGIFKAGYNSRLDLLTQLKSENTQWIATYQTKLREEIGIKTLKVGYTQAFGYYIEISRGQSDKAPLRFQRKQTLVNSERFITAELKEYEHQILSAEAQLLALETELFHDLRKEAASHADLIRKAAHQIATIDALSSLAEVARSYQWTRPLVDSSDVIEIIEGRHPIVEASLTETFIPNDARLDAEERLLVITGPNMAGKSTYMRQVALLTILAQIGSFVPAKRARFGIIDQLFSRIGASDDLSRGQSTFMMEMVETANILNRATDASLVILDEIGRGTSTYDGIAIAWAVAEYLLTQKGRRPKTLFATHYWELNALASQIKGAVNYNSAVHESDDGIVFLRKIVRGGTDKSYGIHVAKLAGLPSSVIDCAQKMLAKLHSQDVIPLRKRKDEQLKLF